MNHSLNFGREQGGGGGAGDLNWVIDSWGHSGGLETQINPATKIDWEWENPALAALNPSQDEADRKAHIMPGLMGQNLRTHNGILQSSYATSYPQSIMYGSTGMVENPVIFSSCSGGYEQRRRFLGLFEEEKGLVKREDGYGRIGLNLGVRTYFSSEDMDMARFGKRARIGGAAVPVPMCQAEGCKADLSMAKHYHRRHKVCEMHSKSSTVVANGLTQRFCQQCSRFHPLSEFDEGKRSCRKRLADHNRRRRKPQPPLQPESSSGKTKDDLNDVAEGKKKGDSSSSTPSLDNSDKLQSSEERICSPKSASNLQIQSHTGQIQEESQSYEQYLQGVCNSKGPSLSLSSTSNTNTNPNPKPEAHLSSITSSKPDAAAAHLSSISSSVPWLRSKQEEQVFASTAFHSLLSLNPSTDNQCSSPDWILGADQPNPAMNLLPIHHRNTFDPKNPVSGQADLKFSDLQASLRPYGSSLYRS